MFKNTNNFLAKYYTETSDSYFATKINSHLLDTVFIDGLHTYEQSLKDFDNSLKHLKKNGVIVMHDCNPPDEAAAYPALSYNHAASLKLPGWTGFWCGDVWKTICYLRSTSSDLKIFVLDCECGLGIITRGEPDNYLNLTPKDIDKMTFKEFSQNRTEFLNLREENFFLAFLNTI